MMPFRSLLKTLTQYPVLSFSGAFFRVADRLSSARSGPNHGHRAARGSSLLLGACHEGSPEKLHTVAQNPNHALQPGW